MLIEAARRVETAAKELLAQAGEGSVSCEEMREALPVLKSAAGIVAAAQTTIASSVATRERHGDGGAEVLAAGVGLPIGEARSHIKTAKTLRQVPAVRDAVESGRVTQANAKQLAAAVEKVGAQAVSADASLLDRAQSLRPDQFRRVARRWTVEREGDDGASEHDRQRARRRLRIWDGDDGMVHLHGEFDAVTGKQIANRLRADAARMHASDRRLSKARGASGRSFDQCMADALEQLTNNTARAGRPFADICVVAHVDDDAGALVGELPDGSKLPSSVLDTLTANAKLTGMIFDRKGKPIWRSESRPTATEAQRQILIAKWGGCFHCGANPGMCQPHHIEPVSQGGPTSIDNLVPACWDCHNLIHRHGWYVNKRPGGDHTLHPPEHIHHGPARAPDQPRLYRSAALPDESRAPPRPAAGPEQPVGNGRAGAAAGPRGRADRRDNTLHTARGRGL